MKTDCLTLILAAGEGKRMKSELPKVLHKAAGKALAEWVLLAARQAEDIDPVLIIGSGADKVKDFFGNSVRYAVQEKQKGTGHAVMCAAEYLTGSEYVLIIAGDMPLLRAQTLISLKEKTVKEKLGASVLTAILDNPTGYGRVVRGNTLRIAEQKDASYEELLIKEVNTSVYCFSVPRLREALDSLSDKNAQKEYYLTDCIAYISERGYGAEAVVCADAEECMGVNDRVQLAEASKVLRRRINNSLMLEGATLIDPDNTYIEYGVKVGKDAVIYPGVTLEGNTVISEGATIYPGSRITDSFIGKRTAVQNSVIQLSSIGEDTTIGPYAYLRPGSKVGNGCRVGDFVEVKNSTIADGAKVSHLSYIGDGEIGEKANIGCGVVFVNYDGIKKSRTIVGKNAFVGCNVNLIAPVKVEEGAYIAAGSTVTKDVEKDALCIARSNQTEIKGWAKRRRGE